jgi:hypothetical protein
VIVVAALTYGGYETVQNYRLEQQLHRSTQELELKAEKRLAASQSPAEILELRRDLAQFRENYAVEYRDLFGSRFVPLADRKQIVMEGLNYLGTVAPEAVQDRDSAAALGSAYLAVAQAQWNPHGPSLNDPKGARATCETALEKLGPALGKFADARNLQDIAGQLGELLRELAEQAKAEPVSSDSDDHIARLEQTPSPGAPWHNSAP